MKEDAIMTNEIRKRIKNQESLLNTFSNLYEEATPISRIILMIKIVQVVDPNQKKRDKEKEKELNKDTIPNFIAELKENLKKLTNPSNIMLIFVGTGYCFLGLENSTDNIMQFIKIYKNQTKMVEDIHIITFNEECPQPNFPVFYKYEGEVYDKESQIYKDVSLPEKAWILYDSYLCNLGRILRNKIRSEADFKSSISEVVKEENNFVKYLPTSNEISEFEKSFFMTIDEFYDMYLDEPKIELDSDNIYPYYWPINV
jgi:hypothetical protein